MNKIYLSDKVRKVLNDSSERNLLKNVFWAFCIKGFSLILSIFATPLYIKYFDNNTVLGVWYTILSVLSWISICDLGLGNGLRNRLTEAIAANNRPLAQKYVSSTYAALIIVMLPLTIIGEIVICKTDLNMLLNVSGKLISPTSLRTGVAVLFLGITTSFIFKIINSVFYAIQKSSINNTLSLIQSFIPFFFVLFFDGESIEKNFVALAVVHASSMVVPLVVATIIAFRLPVLLNVYPSIHSADKRTAKDMFSFGMQFFVAQLFFLVLMSTNELFITHLFAADYVVEYNIYYRLFSFIGSIFMLALTPIWSKITMDITQKNYAKVRATRKVLYSLAGIAIVAEFLLVPFLQFVVNVWLQEDAISVKIETALCFAFFGGIYIINNVLTTIANGIGDLKSQMIIYGTGAIAKVPTLIIACKMMLDWNVVVLYNGIVLLIFCIYQLIWTERHMKSLENSR